MNITKTNLINKICAILAIFALTVADFLPIGQMAVSYAIDAVKTNNANIEFSAYFQNENGEKVENKEVNIDKEEYLYVDVSVKNEGYFNGEIKLADNNFNIKTDKLSEGIAEIKDNVVTLNQINAGSTVTIKLAIEAKKEDSIKSAILNGKTKVDIEGKYINSKNVEKDKYIEIKGEDEVELKWKSEEAANVELGGRLLTNSIYEVNGENKRLVQMLVNSKITNNNYPIKNTEITLNVPEAVEEVTVKARSTEATNKNVEFGEGNYEYNRDEKKLTIKVGNEDPENISWNKEGQDTFVVTYILNQKNNIANEDINIEDKINLYDDKEITGTQNVHIEEEIDGVISGAIESSENEIYKGKIYTGEERDYTETNKVNIDYIEVGDKVEIEQKEATYVGDQERQANIIYKETKIRKDEFQKIFGEEGYITIKDVNGTVLANINKDTEANEEGKIVITYSTVEKEIKMEASKPVTEGTLNIENTKAILNSGYGREEIQRINGIKEKMTVNSKVAEKVITLKETETAGNIMTDVSKISTVADKQTITIGATLDSKGESKNLYKNPTITIKLPKEMTLQTAQYAALYKNGLTVESTNTSKNENGETEVTIKLKGEQTSYDISGGTKVLLKLDVTTNKLTPSKASQIAMTYTNENTSEEKTAIANINFESQYGIMIYNQIVNYNNNGDTIVTVDKETSYGELSTKADKRNMTINTALVNNYGDKVTNVTLIGKIPADQSEEGYVAKLNTLQTNNDKIKVYYTNKQDAQADDSSWGDYREDATSYKVVIDEMDKEEVIKLNIPVTVPENLKYNKKGTFSSVVSCNYQGNTESNTSNIVLATKASMSANSEEKVTTQETEKGLSTKISASVGNDSLSDNDNIYEGQTIKYKVTLTNNTGKDYTNVTVKANQKNGYMWDSVEQEVYNPYDESKSNEHYYEITESNEKNIATIESLKNGESYTYEYEASIYTLKDEKIDGTQTYGTITVASDDKALNETIATIKNNIKEAKLQVQLVNGNTEELEVVPGSSSTKQITVKNLTNETLNNVELKIAYSPKSQMIISLSDELAEKITEQKQNTDKDGITTQTLTIKSIEPNETIEMTAGLTATEDFDVNNDQVWMLAEATTESQDSYVSNKLTQKIHDNSKNYELAQQAMDKDGNKLNTAQNKLQDNEEITFVATVKNNENDERGINLSYYIDDKININNIKIEKEGKEEDLTEQVATNQSNVINEDSVTIQPGETVKITATGTVDAAGTDKLVNELSVRDILEGSTVSDQLSLDVNKKEDKIPTIDEDDDTPKDNELPDDNGNNSNNNNSNNNSNNNNNNNNNNSNNTTIQNPENVYTLKGTAWKDADKDGKRSNSEETIGDMVVDAMNAENGQVVASTKTQADGTYQFNLENGKYIILFHYDNSIYTTTTYQVKGASDTENSDAIEREVTINGTASTVGATDTIAVDKDTSNIDIGLITRNTFDLKVDKYVSKITVTNNDKTTTYDQKENTTLAKAEIKSKNLNGSLVVIEYKIKVTNNGQLAGYARNIVDYMPSTLSFNSSLNSDWYISGNNLYNTSLANTKIEPGESKELTLVLTKTMTESNTGLVNNKAEITESSNEQGIKDETNDKGSADVIISVSTGALVNYIATTVITLIVLAGLAYLVNKKYLSKKM